MKKTARWRSFLRLGFGVKVTLRLRGGRGRHSGRRGGGAGGHPPDNRCDLREEPLRGRSWGRGRGPWRGLSRRGLVCRRPGSFPKLRCYGVPRWRHHWDGEGDRRAGNPRGRCASRRCGRSSGRAGGRDDRSYDQTWVGPPRLNVGRGRAQSGSDPSRAHPPKSKRYVCPRVDARSIARCARP